MISFTIIDARDQPLTQARMYVPTYASEYVLCIEIGAMLTRTQLNTHTHRSSNSNALVTVCVSCIKMVRILLTTD